MYAPLPTDESLSQGDILDDCPIYGRESEGVDCRIVTPDREHLAQHFAVTYMRIGLPDPYETHP
jgi:hypothetical protein